MKFNIYVNHVIYGGPLNQNNYETIDTNVSADFVKGFFKDKEITKEMRTKEDSMGCYKQYKIQVVDLCLENKNENR